MNIYGYQDYKKYVNDWIETQPRKGHGQLRKIATHLRMNSVVMSQVFRGDRELSLEQAVGVSNFMGLTENERNYFLLLVNIARAGTVELKSIYRQQAEELKKKSQSLKNRIKHQKMTDRERATFYSQWYYSAIRLGVSIKRLSTPTAVAEALRLDRKLVTTAIEFLVQNGLVIEKSGTFDIGPQVTFVGHDSPFVSRHHGNWRIQALQHLDSISESNLFYSGPMALSEKAAEEIRATLTELIEKSTKTAANSKSETLRCLNIDWFNIEK